MAPAPSSDGVLRAKYLDWCSARVAERFVELTPDQIWELAEQAQGETGSAGVSSSDDPELRRAVAAAVGAIAPTDRRVVSFRELVERVTEVLRLELELPSYETWLRAYKSEPEKYDEELLGFWRERTEE